MDVFIINYIIMLQRQMIYEIFIFFNYGLIFFINYTMTEDIVE